MIGKKKILVGNLKIKHFKDIKGQFTKVKNTHVFSM